MTSFPGPKVDPDNPPYGDCLCTCHLLRDDGGRVYHVVACCYPIPECNEHVPGCVAAGPTGSAYHRIHRDHLGVRIDPPRVRPHSEHRTTEDVGQRSCFECFQESTTR